MTLAVFWYFLGFKPVYLALAAFLYVLFIQWQYVYKGYIECMCAKLSFAHM